MACCNQANDLTVDNAAAKVHEFIDGDLARCLYPARVRSSQKVLLDQSGESARLKGWIACLGTTRPQAGKEPACSDQVSSADMLDEKAAVSQRLEYFYVERQNDVTIVTPIVSDFRGDVINVESKKELVHFADSVKPEKVVIDFQNVHSFSTDFVGTLLSFKKRIPFGGAVKLCSLQPVHREIFQIFHLDGTVFPILETVQDAVRSFA